MTRTIHYLILISGFLAAFSVASAQERNPLYDRGARLFEDRKYEQALSVFREGLEAAKVKEDHYYAYFVAREIANCQRRLLNVDGYLEAATEALVYLDRLEESGSKRMSPYAIAFERTLLVGLVAKHYLFAHQLALARQWHNREGEELLKLVSLYGEKDYDLLSGDLPRRVPRKFRVQIPRYLWMGAWLLEKEAQTEQALAHLNAADRFLDHVRSESDLNEIEKSFRYRISNRKGQVLDFLGYIEEAIAIQGKIAAEPLTGIHARSVLLERLNLYRNLSQYHGPSEELLEKAVAAHNELKNRAASGDDLLSRQQINKMIFDLRRDGDVAGEFAAIEETLARSGFHSEADYSEREQILVGISLGETEGLEARLIDLLEKFRSQGNRVGVPTLYREYGNLLTKLGRHDEAVYMYRQALTLSAGYGWVLHLPRLMVKLAEAHLALGNPAAAEAWIEAIEKHLAEHPETPAHRVAETKAELVDLLNALGRPREAASLRAWTFAFAEAEAVPDIWVRSLREHTMVDAASQAEEKTGVVEAKVARQIDLQPRRVSSEVASGETAHARFTLANLSGHALSGILKFPPGVAVASWVSEEGVLRLQVGGSPGVNVTESQALQIGPAEMIRVFVESAGVTNAIPRELEFEWARNGFETRKSEWSIAATDTLAELTVVNGNMIEFNPFYFVPLYHAVRLRSFDEPVRDFRVKSSVPCYVELIDEATDTILAVDRLGDGSFGDKGDIVSADENGNLYPDVRFSEDASVFGLELRIFPTDLDTLEGVEEVTVSLEGLVSGKWEVLAENRVVIPETSSEPAK